MAAATLTARHVAAQRIARKAGEMAHDFFVRRDALTVEFKGAQDFVSHADRSVEKLIAAELASECPGDAFLGEETAASFKGKLDRIWVVDPIDGTHNFLRGVRYYCVSIAYIERGVREIGVIYDPEHGELFHARRGHGAWVESAGNQTQLHTTRCANLAQAFVCVGHNDRYPEERYIELKQKLMDAGVAMRNMGAGALQLAHVAAGRFDGFVELSLNAWDAAAGLLLIEEAGGYAGPFPGPEGLLVPAPVLGCAKGIAWPLVELIGVW
jgi:myo-inositol-1(or 4)-monophosphatase